MGRHGTGGSDDGEERGNGSAFWGPDEHDDAPGWPSLPDQPEVTGQWAPMPRRADGPAPRAPQSEPFETTGAFAVPSDSAGGLPPANDPAGAFTPPPSPRGDDSGPFETTGAFTRPSDWNPPVDRPGGFFDGAADQAGPGKDPFDEAGDGPFGRRGDAGAPGGFDRQEPFNGPDQTSVFGGGQGGMPGRDAQDPGQTAFFGGPQPGGSGPFEQPDVFSRPGPSGQPGPNGRPGPFDQPDVFGQPGPSGQPGSSGQPGPFDQPDVFGQPGPFDRPGAAGRPDPFARPGAAGSSDPFDRPSGQSGPFDQPGPFDGRDERSGPFGGPDSRDPFDSYDEDANRTARFDGPPGPGFAAPPEPGDIKVAGEPTAVHNAPAWAEAETGFLGSGWASDSDVPDEEPRGRRGRRRSGRGGGGGDDDMLAAAPGGAGKGRVALLSVAAVAVVLGGTVAGVKFMSSGDPAKCEGVTCAAVQTTGQPGPAVSEPAEEEDAEPAPEEEPTEEAEETEPADTPKPTATYSARAPRRTATPTPTKSKVKKTAEPTDDPLVDEPPVDETVSEAPTEDPAPLEDTDAGTGVGTPESSDNGDPGTFEQSSNAGSVNVKQTIQQRLTTYKARMTVSNDSARTLQSPTVSVPVDGRVVDVDGAEWSQDGDLLILDVSGALAAGDTVEVSFTATGRGSKAQNCGMVEGECAVS